MAKKREIWQFGKEFICIEDGSSATKEEIEELKDNNPFLKYTAEERKLIEEKEEKKKALKELKANEKWFAKNGKKVMDYFSLSSKEESYCYSDEYSLEWRLATRIFDLIPDSYWVDYNPRFNSKQIKEFNKWANKNKTFSNDLKKMAKIFPKNYKNAVIMFLEGNHDT